MSRILHITGFSTWVYKVLFPLFWFGVSIPVLLFGESKPSAHIDPGTSKALGWLFFMGFGALATWMASRLRTVALDGEQLEIAGLFEQVRVPLREVTEIRTLTWYSLGSGNPVSLSFSEPTRFLEAMLFLPRSDEDLDALRAAWQELRERQAAELPPAERERLEASVRLRPRMRIPDVVPRRVPTRDGEGGGG